jgi:hypothetical protein
MNELDSAATQDLLERFERMEDPLLSWGAVNGALSEEDVERVVEEWLDEREFSVDRLDPLDIIDELLDGGHLVRADDVGGYRTRIAELLRLLVNLRQLFPARGGGDTKWRGAPSLVGGIRYTRRPRHYPARDVDPMPLLEALTRPGTLEREVFRRLITSRHNEVMQLSGFQARATRSVLGGVGAGRSTGAIVGAGTGSGKTLAFYLPALTHLAGTIGPNYRLGALALYPRNELLRDQLQAGVAQAMRLKSVIHEGAGRPLRVGALFGAVPQTIDALRRGHQRAWRRQGEEFVCPYLTCPGSEGQGCGGPLVARASDSGADEPALRCVDCASTLDPAVFPVTRDQLRRRPADLLYCSTEMLNRGLLDPTTARVLGMDIEPGPSLVLLDEVHTYGGTSGAMTALTLRRWRQRVNSEPLFTGLSATLVDAPQFFGDLVGLPADKVADIAPDPNELIPEGAEYQIVVRGEPTSGAGLLSTTIQTAMLLGRSMDAVNDGRSGGLFGQKVFAFTDDLDVTNRLYFDLLDAEGQRHRSSGSHLAYKPSLAHLRSPASAEVAARRRAGQVWDLAVATGHGLDDTDRLKVGRTSSQDAGLDTRAQVIVATASLEVGVDDPTVGAVLQHKAPRDNAAFLQRQGRAGRERGMRPLTVVVLSDFGRDRQTYEAWDQLLSPVLRPSPLPVRNVHVLRMHAALAALGWAVSRAGADVRGQNMWGVLSGPPRDRGAGRQRAAQHAVAEHLRLLLTSEEAQASLVAYLQTALHIESNAAVDLLWQPPRPVLLAVVDRDGPLVYDSEQGGSPVAEDAGARQPLPSFIPPTLFSPLALPEVIVDMPDWSADRSGQVTSESLGLTQALRELTPGRVTKRFAVGSDLDRAWVAVAPGAETLELSEFVTLSQHEGELNGLPLVRPLRIRTEQPSEELRDSTNGRAVWSSEIIPRGDGTDLAVTGSAESLGRLVTRAEAHLHRDHQQLEVRRGVVASDVRLVMRGGDEHIALVGLVQNGSPVALGGAFDVDGLRFVVEIDPPQDAWTSHTGPALRTGWFQERVTQGLRGVVDPFLVGWVHEIILTGLLQIALEKGFSLEQAWADLRSKLVAEVPSALQVLFAAPPVDLEELDPEGRPRKLLERLRTTFAEAVVRDRLDALVPVLWEAPGADAEAWLKRRLLRTVGETLLAGAAMTRPDHDPDSIVLDVEPTGSTAGEIWLTEMTVGGGGFLEAIADALATDPKRFFRLAHASLRPGSTDSVARALHQVVLGVRDGGQLNGAFSRFRAADGANEQARALDELRTTMRSASLTVTPEAVGAVVTRLLRPGSTSALDETVGRSYERWLTAEDELGVEIPLRTWCYLDALESGTLDTERLEQLQLVLWPRGSRTHDRQLASYNPFSDEPEPAAELLSTALKSTEPSVISYTSPDQTWAHVEASLRTSGSARVRASGSRIADCLGLVARAATDAIELDVLRLHPELTGLSVDAGGDITLDLELPSIGAWARGDAAATPPVPRARVRRVMTAGGGPTTEVQQLLHMFFASELVQASTPLWIVSAWLSDVTVLDNRGGEMLSVAPGLPTRRLGIVEVIHELVVRGGDVRVVVREDPHNRTVVARLRDLGERTTAGRLTIDSRTELHDKLMVSDRLLLEGSMNLTHRGATRNEEGVRVVGEPDDVATQRGELVRRCGGQR